LHIRIKRIHLIGWTPSTWPSLFRDTGWDADIDRSISAFIYHYKLNTIQTFTFKLGINNVNNTRKTQDEIETTCTNRNFKNTFNDPDKIYINNLHLSVRFDLFLRLQFLLAFFSPLNIIYIVCVRFWSSIQ
jgi:hypothetical protein